MGWFGSIDLAWQYAMIFGILLVAVIIAGLIKLFYDRHRVENYAKAEAEAAKGKGEDQVELTQREKDEGDLFGIRALEAGFYAGIPQSRPVSRATSYTGTPSMSSNTLIGSLASPKILVHSASSSVTSLPPARLSERNSGHDATKETQAPRRKSPPNLKLQPSEAELNGRLNHSVAVNMDLQVPPSPTPLKSPVISIHDYDEAARSPSPHSKPDHYIPSAPPQLPMPESLDLRMSALSNRSQVASYHDGASYSDAPTSPKTVPTPAIRIPSMTPTGALEDDRSGGPVYSEDTDYSAEPEASGEGREEPVRLLPRTYQPSHNRDQSDASSIYSENRHSTQQLQRSESSASESAASYKYTPKDSTRDSVEASAPLPAAVQGRLSALSSLAPSSAQSSARLSEFYDAYYRQSTMGVPAPKTDAKRPPQLDAAPDTIQEVETPGASPLQTKFHQPGMAM